MCGKQDHSIDRRIVKTHEALNDARTKTCEDRKHRQKEEDLISSSYQSKTINVKTTNFAINPLSILLMLAVTLRHFFKLGSAFT